MPLFLHDFWSLLKSSWPPFRGLSGKLLVLTIVFLLAAEMLILIPTVAAFRTDWFKERLEAAQLASLALDAAPNGDIIPDQLRTELLENAEVRFIRLARDDVNQLILASPGVGVATSTVDLRSRSIWKSLMETCVTAFSPTPEFIRVLDTPRMEGGEEIEIIVPGRALKDDFWRFTRRIAAASLAISIIAGVIVYIALSVAFVRPMRDLASAMTRFREQPDDAARVIKPSGRTDEIGQAETELATLQDNVRQALKQREHLAALGAAVAKINHDLRNVFTAAQLISDRLAQNPDPKTRGQGERLVRAVGRGMRLTEDVLKFGRAEETEPDARTVPLRMALEDAFADAAVAAEGPIGLDLKVDEEICVWADPDHVHRIFVNLIRNGVQAMAAQPGRETPGSIILSARAENGDLVVLVRDQGPGVPERARVRLFEPFSASTRRGGSGLGLSICRELARANGGDVWLADSDNTGAVFAVRLSSVDGGDVKR